MKAVHVVSSNIDAIGYQNGKLFIRFNSGTAYSYDAVPYTVFSEMQDENGKDEGSVGRYFHRHVRSKFPYHKLNVDPFVARRI